jgi:pimeloyl-ACP methyl ester carboxylesterase
MNRHPRFAAFAARPAARVHRTRDHAPTPVTATLAAWAAAALLAVGVTPPPLAADPLKTGRVELPEATIHYRESGTGRPALFVHALLIDSRLWLDQLRDLKDLRRNLAPDLSGFGFSSPMVGTTIDYERYADELLAFLDAMKIREPVDLVAVSAGGNAAALAYRKQPQRFRSMVLISVAFSGAGADPAGVRYRAENARTVVIEGRDTLYRRFNEYIVGPQASLIARARYKTMLEQTPYESMVAFLTTKDGPALGGFPATVQIPVMIPYGRDDTVVPVDMVRRVAGEFPNARTVAVPTAARLLPLEAAPELSAAIRAFWTELDGGSKR